MTIEYLMIIEYWLEYDRIMNSFGARCCGSFASWKDFDAFVKVQKSYGKTVSQINIVKG